MSRYTPGAAGPSTLSRRERTTLAPPPPPSTLPSPTGSYHPSPLASGRSSPHPHPYPESPWSRANGLGGLQATDDLEGQNDERVEGLLGKVRQLKDLTVGIGNEVRDSTIQLSQMNDAFAETGSILSGTFRRMTKMASRQGGRWCWFMMFMVLVFWIFIGTWLWRR